MAAAKGYWQHLDWRGKCIADFLEPRSQWHLVDAETGKGWVWWDHRWKDSWENRTPRDDGATVDMPPSPERQGEVPSFSPPFSL
jgi:hypothetical protein